MESDTMELLRLMLAHLRPRLQGRDEEWQALERKQQELMASFRETHGGDVPLLEEVLEMEDPAEAIDAFLAKKLGDTPPEDRRAWKRVSDALARRGYAWSDISEGLRRYGAEAGFEE